MRSVLRQDLDWTYILEQADWHALAPLLYWHLNTVWPQAVPQPSMERLRECFEQSARRNLYLTGELCVLLGLFKARGISAVPFKGPILAFSIYGDLALRRFFDLDILVRRRDVIEARNIILDRKFRPDLHLTPEQEADYLESAHDLLFTRDDGAILELHWAVAERYFSFPLDYQPLWDRLESVSIAGREILTLCAEDLLLILCVHGTRHLWRGLGWICDIAELIRARPGINWRWLIEQARTAGGKRMLLLGVFLAADLLGAPAPPEVLERAQSDASVRELARQVEERLFLTEAHPNPFGVHSFYLRSRERLRDRVRYCLRLALTPNEDDWAVVPLPAWLRFAYRLIRPFRLLKTYVG